MRAASPASPLAPNCPEYLEIFSACESANLIIVNMNYRLSARELIDICRDCEPSAGRRRSATGGRRCRSLPIRVSIALTARDASQADQGKAARPAYMTAA